MGHGTHLAGIPLDGAKGQLATKGRQAVQGKKFSPVGETWAKLAQAINNSKKNRIIMAKTEKSSETSEFIFCVSRINFSKNVSHRKGKG